MSVSGQLRGERGGIEVSLFCMGLAQTGRRVERAAEREEGASEGAILVTALLRAVLLLLLRTGFVLLARAESWTVYKALSVGPDILGRVGDCQ